MIVPILFCAALVLIAGCTTTPTPAPTTAPEAVVANACYDSKGHVTFEIVNTGTAEAVIDYAWTLIDPATGEPIDAGEGSVTLGPDEFEGVSAPINTTIPHDDAGNSIICVNLSVDGKTIHQYRQ
ncbi:hypothetical protein [Methanofollis aquaemaris]|uniref:hypothetical protein n=1 Tax=Methanofollis aquaemaris TaxID=126734 RepID=UPI00223EC6BE|nr:hypothetical protein [Methanofollis aquaemaris]